MERLYLQLKEAYTDENLNRITGRLIELYKSKSYGVMRGIANKISPYVDIDEKRDDKLFPKLVSLYHPDKGVVLRESLESSFLRNDLGTLHSLRHILELQNLDQFTDSATSEELDYNPVYAWEDSPKEGYFGFDEDESEDYSTSSEPLSFYNAVKIRMYGDLSIDYPAYYLEDIEDFELSQSGIETLEGVEHCRHLVRLDLSDNQVTDVSELWNLERLEELYLANNQIGYVDALSNLSKLRVIDISGNEVDDLSPLFELERLEYVNVLNNPVSAEQVKELREQGVLVIF